MLLETLNWEEAGYGKARWLRYDAEVRRQWALAQAVKLLWLLTKIPRRPDLQQSHHPEQILKRYLTYLELLLVLS